MTAQPLDEPQAALDLQAMRAHAGEAVAMLKLLGNEDRLLLLCQLSQQLADNRALQLMQAVHQLFCQQGEVA